MADKKDNVWVAVGRYTGMAFLLPLSTFVGYVIGYLLDKLFHTNFLYIVFLILGSISGFVSLFRELKSDE